jgi:RNA polymerase sigma factor (sigma-70 family)
MTEPRPHSDGDRGSASIRIDWPHTLAQHDRMLRAVVAARLGERQAVEEVLHEIALAAVAGRDRLADATRVTPWLYRLAVRQTLLYRRKHGRARRLLDRFAATAPAGEFDSRSVDPLEWLLADERGALVRQGLARLAPRDREILLLKYTEDWSYQQIAARLAVSCSAVEARLHRARGRLREELSAMNVSEAKT